MAEGSRDDLAALDVRQLAQRCAAEQQRYHQHQPSDDRYCLELFLRAIEQRDELAWTIVYQQFCSTLLAWLHQHPCANRVLAREEPDTYAAAAFSKFWMATTSTSGPPPRFVTLAGVLAYLKSCLNSVVLDEMRRPHPEEPLENLDQTGVNDASDLSAQELWALIERALPDRRERRLAYLLFVLELKPREVVRFAPRDYPTAHDVYRLRRNIEDRLRRNPRLLQWLKGDQT